MNTILLLSRLKFQRLCDTPKAFQATFDYCKKHALNQQALFGFIGSYGVIDIVDCGNSRFDFADRCEGRFTAFVFEVYDKDGETVIDLIAWPIDHPERIYSMFGKCGLLGAWNAWTNSHYDPLPILKTGLEWLKNDCRGAVVIQEHVAARELLDVHCQIAGEDYKHSKYLQNLIQSVIPKNRVVVPSNRRIAA